MISAILSPATAADTGAIRRYQQQQKQSAELILCSTKGAPRVWRHQGEAIRPTRWDVANFPPTVLTVATDEGQPMDVGLPVSPAEQECNG